MLPIVTWGSVESRAKEFSAYVYAGLALTLCNSVDVQWSVNVIPQPSCKVWEGLSASIHMSTLANACSEDFGGQPFAKWFVPWCMIELPRLAKQSWHWLVNCRARICASAVALLL